MSAPTALTVVLWHPKEAKNAQPDVAQKLIPLPPQLVPSSRSQENRRKENT